MAKSECVWFRNRSTGAVHGIEKNSPGHRRCLTEVTAVGEDETPEPIWEKIPAPKCSSTKYKSGTEAIVHTPKNPDDAEAELAAQADTEAAAKAKADAEAEEKAKAAAKAKAAQGGSS